MKKFITALGTVALLSAAIVPAFAGNNCVNGTTGPGSNNTCTITNASNVSVNNVNDAQIVNRVYTNSNTGGNSASNNTLGGNVTTGNASSNNTVSSVANINTTNISVGFDGGNNTGANNVTGPFSNNSAFITNAHDVRVWNSNTASVNNDVSTNADTGNNNADNNTGPATIMTGDARLSTGVQTHVNDSLTALDLSAGGAGNNTAGSSTTGPFSSNDAVITNAINAAVNNVNDLQVRNDVDVRAKSGNNSASNNTLGGSIGTGSATAGTGVNTEGNINTTQIAAAMGGFGNVDAGSTVTGPDSSNDSFVTNDRNVSFDNWNNKCLSHNAPRLNSPLGAGGDYSGDSREGCNPANLGVLNDVYTVSDAGNSNADNNTAGGGVMSGWAAMSQSVMTHLNDVLNNITL